MKGKLQGPDRKKSSESFGKHVFSRSVMQRMLPLEIYQNIIEAAEGKGKIKEEHADPIAVAIKEWAVSHGATHYTHWFQPLTGASAEKHDSFIDWHSPDRVIERFQGKQLLQGEPDASSFPSGGLRSTFEARGYTGWDPTSPIFVWKGEDGITLCIPSVYYSWTGECLDTKIPLLRSDRSLSEQALRLLKLSGIAAETVHSSIGLEQEYFVVDRHLREQRSDLQLTGRTVFGAPSPKGQELQDHYFGAVKDRVLSYMHDFEQRALAVGIPVKTRHNEVAPAQHEVAPVFERSSRAIDHNIILMELMRKTAEKHNLACLLHEKPFANLNGSGKHCNWSLVTNEGFNLLDPSKKPRHPHHFLVLLAAILQGIHRHSALLRASIATAGNDLRLGGHEAPPAVLSVYLGQELEEVLNEIEERGTSNAKAKEDHYDLGLPSIPPLPKDNTDRNRTSPFAFTGNKFEFRAVGSSQNPSFSVTCLNVIVAESLKEILDEIEKGLQTKGKVSAKAFGDAAMPVLRKVFRETKAIRYSGDNYCDTWKKEAEKRKLPILNSSVEAFPALISSSTKQVFKGVLNEVELKSRHDVAVEIYVQTLAIEVKVALDLFWTAILPGAIESQKAFAESIRLVEAATRIKEGLPHQHTRLLLLSSKIELAIASADKVQSDLQDALAHTAFEERAAAFSNSVLKSMDILRGHVDELEQIVADTDWPIPKYRELLFQV